MFRKAERRAAKLRLALTGPSGSGKTFSGLKIAQGLGGKIAVIDTENGSAELYSHICDYDVCQLHAPYSPERFRHLISEAEGRGYNVLIIDSLSLAWSGIGGVLEMADNASKSVRNSFAAWREVTPAHNALINRILTSALDIIVTMRTKTAYEVVVEDGKAKPKKVGLAAIQREGLEYEFTAVFDLSVDGHIATSSKDRTGLFDGKYFKPDTSTGQLLRQWLNGNSVAPVADMQNNPQTTKPRTITTRNRGYAA
jgi:hypothetical protein